MSIEQARSLEIPPGERAVKSHIPEEVGEFAYTPSESEKLLEELCRSFGTELESASMDYKYLIRLSRPVELRDENSDRHLLQVQFTRFSPFSEDGKKVAEVYRANTKTRKSQEKILKEVWQELKNHKTINTTLLDAAAIDNVNLARWRKGFYFAVFNLRPNEIIPSEPFNIYEGGGHGVGEFNGRTPDLHIAFIREPIFFVHSARENEERLNDHLYLSWPRAFYRETRALGTAQDLYPLPPQDRYSLPGENPIFQELKNKYIVIPATIPPVKTLAFIQTYIRRFATGATL